MPTEKFQYAVRRYADATTEEELAVVRELISEAIEEGDPYACVASGLMHERGEGGTADFEQAVELYQRAAQFEITIAYYHLGRILFVNRRYPEATRWLNLAMEDGEVDAAVLMGICYENGKGVERDPDSATSLYEQVLERDEGRDAIVKWSRVVSDGYSDIVGDVRILLDIACRAGDEVACNELARIVTDRM